MNKITKNRLITALSLIAIGGVLFFVFNNTNHVSDEELYNQYMETVNEAQQLFQMHKKVGSYYSNEQFAREEDVYQALDETFTDSGVDSLLSSVFKKVEGDLVYKQKYQQYLENLHSPGEGNITYYETVKNTLLNPGLPLIKEDDVAIYREDNKVYLAVEDASVAYYDDNSPNRNYLKRYGYPSGDRLSIEIIFVRHDNGLLKVSDYNVESSPPS
ncbi:hypothetical protein [Alteribacter aurantiacus]|uniref:hypothetical protein n=1 Tax=Alteribacter aurantiacus TaxID=254410 RepID=UPI0004271B9B|nr:hypothetical protein [Alteribacter aurantiacus]